MEIKNDIYLKDCCFDNESKLIIYKWSDGSESIIELSAMVDNLDEEIISYEVLLGECINNKPIGFVLCETKDLDEAMRYEQNGFNLDGVNVHCYLKKVTTIRKEKIIFTKINDEN